MENNTNSNVTPETLRNAAVLADEIAQDTQTLNSLQAKLVELQANITSVAEAMRTKQANLDAMLGRQPQTVSAKRTLTPEGKQKIRDAQLARWAKVREAKANPAPAPAPAPVTETVPVAS